MDLDQLEQLKNVYSARAHLFDDLNRVSPWHALHRRLTAVKLRELISCGSILDLACGTGLTSRELAERGCRVTMLDILPEMCSLAGKALRPEYAERVEVICGDACSYREFPEASFDAVICTQALNFFPQPAKLFETAAFAVRPGGIFYLDVDTAYRWAIIEALTGRVENATAILERGVDAAKAMIGTDYYFYSQALLERELKCAGFEISSTFGMLYATPLLRLLHPGIGFLEPDKLHPIARQFLSPEKLDELLVLEEKFTQRYPAEVAGYQVFVARKVGPER